MNASARDHPSASMGVSLPAAMLYRNSTASREHVGCSVGHPENIRRMEELLRGTSWLNSCRSRVPVTTCGQIVHRCDAAPESAPQQHRLDGPT